MRLLAFVAILGVIFGAPIASAAPPSNITNTVGVCDPNAPSHCVAPDSSGRMPVTGSFSASLAVAPVTTTNASGTVTTGGTFQSVLASSGSRNGCLIENPTTATEPLFVFFGANASATTANSISLGAGSSVSCAVGGLAVATDNVSVTAATTGHAFIANRQ